MSNPNAKTVFVIYKGKIEQAIFVRPCISKKKVQGETFPLVEVRYRKGPICIRSNTVHESYEAAVKALAVFKTWMMEKDMKDIKEGYNLMSDKDKLLLKKKIQLLTNLE